MNTSTQYTERGESYSYVGSIWFGLVVTNSGRAEYGAVGDVPRALVPVVLATAIVVS